jgi:F-type H+-transporting ATPase subunit epsilon
MNLKILLPANVLLDQPVQKVIAEAANGSFCLLPKHRDFVTSLVPGVLIFVDEGGAESFVGVSEGILTKSGSDIRVSARRAVRSEYLGELQRVVRDDFRSLDERERVAQTVIARLEADFMRRFLALEESPRV